MTEMERVQLMGQSVVLCPSREHLCQVCHCWPAQWATKGSRAVNALHELLSSPPGGGTNTCPHLGGSDAHLGGSGGLNAEAPFTGRSDIVRSHLSVKTTRTLLRKALQMKRESETNVPD